jgi:hypothetical protein
MIGRRGFLASGAWLLILVVITAGCTQSKDSPSDRGTNQAAEPHSAGQSAVATGQGVTIDFRSKPDPPKSGDNTFEVTVKRPDGSPVTDATVTAVFSMPAMPSMNMPAMRSDATLAHEAAGRYRGRAQLSMAGTWNVTVVVSRGLEELANKKFSLVAK